MGRPSFTIIGFPVTVRTGFVLGLLVILAINLADPAFAWRLVVALAVFTLVHELGHAAVARHFGAEAAISLNFLVGYAVYRPSRPLTRLQRAGISAAGPAVEIALGVAVLALLGVSPFALDEIRTDATALAVWWAGPVLGAVNLLPLVPLDGGNILALGVDRLVPGRGRTVLSYLTVAACGVAIVAVAVSPALRPWSITVVLFSFFALQDLAAERRTTRGRSVDTAALVAAARAAERQGWRDGQPGPYPPPFGPSPFLRAEGLRRAGRTTTATQLLDQALRHGAGTWVPPPPDVTEQVVAVLELLPPEPPVGDPATGAVLQDLLHRAGYLRRAADYGTRLYEAHPDAGLARRVAESFALLGDEATAREWAERARG